jgi:hypothetical protein
LYYVIHKKLARSRALTFAAARGCIERASLRGEQWPLKIEMFAGFGNFKVRIFITKNKLQYVYNGLLSFLFNQSFSFYNLTNLSRDWVIC